MMIEMTTQSTGETDPAHGSGLAPDAPAPPGPFRLAAARHGDPARSGVEIGGVRLGGGGFSIIAGPCAVESRERTLGIAESVREGGAAMLRGGAYKPRSSPYSFRGLGAEGLEILAEAKRRTGLPVVTELVDVRDVAAVAEVADVVQIGARNMQNYALLEEAGHSGCAVLLKRGLAATLEELLMAAEYVLRTGNQRVILCERGIRTHESAYRFTLDLLAVPALREMTHLPVIVDPSHAAGRRDWVRSMALAAAASGADGIIVEVHDEPEQALCDGPQAIRTERFGELAERATAIAALAAEEAPAFA